MPSKRSSEIGVYRLWIRWPVALRAHLVVALAAACLPAAAGIEEHSYEVIPSTWVTADGAKPPVGATTSGSAFIFPSTLPGETIEDGEPFTIPDALRDEHAHFHARKPYCWPDTNCSQIRITVTRRTNEKNKAVDLEFKFTNLGSIRQLSFKDFRRLQRGFDRWMRRRASRFWWGDGSAQFVDLHKTLLVIWTEHALPKFSDFARSRLNRQEFDVSSDSPPMHVVPLRAWDQLTVSWGTSVLYPATTTATPPTGTLNNGYSRPSVGGVTSLTVTPQDGGLVLFPPSRSLSTDPVRIPANSTTSYPFPINWAQLFDVVFVPIYNVLDLHSVSLLAAGTNPATPASPPSLFLLIPSSYAKADTAGLGSTDLAQYPLDARTTRAQIPDVGPEFLTRRFAIVATGRCAPTKTEGVKPPFLCQAEVQAEFKKLIDSTKKPNTPSIPAYLAGFFMNQTSVNISHRVFVGGHPLPLAVSDTETWRDVIAEWVQHAGIHEPAGEGKPFLRIRRSVAGDDGLPSLRMVFYFHTIDAGVLGAARIGEGDEFDAVSKILRK
jgi:hypothetical protein